MKIVLVRVRRIVIGLFGASRFAITMTSTAPLSRKTKTQFMEKEK